MREKFNVNAFKSDNLKIVSECHVIFLAIKPKYIMEVMEQIAPHLKKEEHLVVSIVAGYTLEII